MPSFKINTKLIRLIALIASIFLITACNPLESVLYQGATTNLGLYQADEVITGSIVGEKIALSDDGLTLVSEDWRRRSIYRKFGANWPQVYVLDYRPTSGSADDKGTPWFVPKLDETGNTLLTSHRDLLRTFMPQSANGQDWQEQRFLNATLDAQSHRYSEALLSGDGNIAALSHKTTSDGSFTLLDKDITIWQQQAGNWLELSRIERIADNGVISTADNFAIRLVDINRDGSKILVVGPNGAFVHTRSGDSWQSSAELSATSNIFSFEERGAISASGNRVALQASVNSANGPRTIVFDLANGTWQQSTDLQGRFMAMSSDGQTLVLQNFVQTGTDFIGTPQSQGFLEVFNLSGGSWQKVATIAPSSDRNSYQAVALNADGSVMAATLQDPPFSTTMRLEIYTR